MSVVGIQFNKIVLDKKGPAKGKVSVNNNVSVTDVTKTDLSFGASKQTALQFNFEFKVNYEPGIAELTFLGYLTYFEKPEAIEEVLKSWKKDKKVPKEKIKLKVAETVQDDVNKGIVRVDANFMRELNAKQGDIIEIEGQRKTLAIVDRAYPSDIGLDFIRMDGLTRKNSRTGIGEQVKIRKIIIKEAKKVTIAP